MCSGSKRKLDPTDSTMEAETKNKQCLFATSVLLELSASNDLTGFKKALEEEGHDINEVSLWYGRKIGSKNMGLEERTPLMIAAMFGSKDVVSYILEKGHVDVNKTCGSDGATALHCAVAGGSATSSEVIKLLLDASTDTNESKLSDVIIPALNSTFNSKMKNIEIMLNNGGSVKLVSHSSDHMDDKMEAQLQQEISTPRSAKDASEKKEYPIDLSLPDINNGIYGTDEFRMYTFKVKPCSRAYSHDWTECPFVHPGENARRRDPRKYHYSCVPCPEFRKGSCRQGDACEYAHGIFESWLHPAQYRTRLCKDEVGCSRRVCFFAHKPEELRPLYASTGSAVPSPRSFSAAGPSFDMGSISLLSLGAPAVFMPSSTQPMSPTGTSSPMVGAMWQNQSNIVPPTLQLPSSRLKSTSSARDINLDIELLGLESHRRRQLQLMDEMSGFSSPTWSNSAANTASFAASPSDRMGELDRFVGLQPTNLEDYFGSIDPTVLTHNLQGLSLDGTCSQFQSPTGIQMHQNMNQQLRSSYPASLSSSPARHSSPFRMDSSGPSASAVFNSKSAAFAKRSQSFIDRSPANRLSAYSSPATASAAVPSTLSDWGSPDGKLNWGIHGEELSKLRKSASFGVRSSGNSTPTAAASLSGKPDVPWARSLTKGTESVPPEQVGLDEEQLRQYHLSSGGSEKLPAWVEQMFMEQEQMVA